MTFCYKNNIILCRLASHTSHKLQPCDVGVFGPLKTAYRDQVERLCPGGASTVGKQHFTLLYSRARKVAFTARNIESARAKTELVPFSPDRVLRDIQKPQTKQDRDQIERAPLDLRSPHDLLPTPVTAESFQALRKRVQQESQHLDAPGKHRLQKLANVAEKAIADRALLIEEKSLLFNQNNEKMTRSSTRSTVVRTADIMSYDDIVEAQRKREVKETSKKNGKRRQTSAASATGEKQLRATEVEKGNPGIVAWGLKDYCSALPF